MRNPAAILVAASVVLVTAVPACTPEARPPAAAAAGSPAKSPAPGAAAGTWTTTLDVGHPLVGKVWDARRHRFTGPDDVIAAVSHADFAILGEKHDNADHHALQARVLRGALAAGRTPAVAFEMLDVDQQPTVDAYVAAPGATAAGFGPRVDWDGRGWTSYAWYAPIVDAALGAHLPIVAANLRRGEMREIVHEGPDKIPPARAKELGLDTPLPPAQMAELLEEMRTSHCGKLSEEMLLPMATAQRARDGALGGHMIEAGKARPVVLIAGNGHARTDRGVPAFLYAHAKSGASVVSVAFLEVEHGVNEPAPEPYDYVWYTPRASDEDPCAKMGSLKR